MCGYPIGRQPFRPGQWSGYRGSGSINIYHKEVYNNYGGAMFPMNYGMYNMGYGGYNQGLTSGEKWMLALGGITSIGGAILGALGKTDNEAKTDTPETPAPNNNNGFDDKLSKMQEENDQLNKQLKDVLAENKKLQQQVDNITALKKASEAYEIKRDPAPVCDSEPVLCAGAREVETEETTSFLVEATKNEDGTVTGHTGYNIVAKMYKNEDGTPLTNTDIKALTNKIFQGKALKVGNIELPNEIEVNGKTYSINPEGKNDVQKVTYGLSKHEVYQSGAKQEGSYWIPTLGGKDLDGRYNTEAEAKAAAEKAASENADK